MARLIVIALRLVIWLLLSADLDMANVAIGVAVALALPLPRRLRRLSLRQLGQAFAASLGALPQAYREAAQLLLHPRLERSEVHDEPVLVPGRPSSALVFLDVFRITLTPFTIALGLDDGGRSYRVHKLVIPPRQKRHQPAREKRR
ncbi:MAG: Na+/H+ antiporter subunit E [Prochlorococcaceae cyanobacterium]